MLVVQQQHMGSRLTHESLNSVPGTGIIDRSEAVANRICSEINVYWDVHGT